MQQQMQSSTVDVMSWARAIIFGIGFFFLATLLIGQIPSYIYLGVTSSSMLTLEQSLLSIAATCFGVFIILQVVMLLFDPKPVVDPAKVILVGVALAVLALLLIFIVSITQTQYFPSASLSFLPLLGGNFLWFQSGAIDILMLCFVALGIGLAMMLYGYLALQEMHDSERRDPGMTRTIKKLYIIGFSLLFSYIVFALLVSDQGLAWMISATAHNSVQYFLDMILDTVLGIALISMLGAVLLRFHYLLRPVRQDSMRYLYMTGMILAQIGAIAFFFWVIVYPLLAWMQSWSFLGLGSLLTQCAKISVIPGSCSFTQQAGYIIDTIITMNGFALLVAAVFFWNSRRTLVMIAGIVTMIVLGLVTLLTHTYPDELLTAMLVCGGILFFSVLWTNVARREFAPFRPDHAVGCLGQWLIFGTCFFVYLTAFAFFSIPGFHESVPNIPFSPGLLIPPHVSAGQTALPAAPDAVIVCICVGIVALIHFYFLVRNRYKIF